MINEFRIFTYCQSNKHCWDNAEQFSVIFSLNVASILQLSINLQIFTEIHVFANVVFSFEVFLFLSFVSQPNERSKNDETFPYGLNFRWNFELYYFHVNQKNIIMNDGVYHGNLRRAMLLISWCILISFKSLTFSCRKVKKKLTRLRTEHMNASQR